MSEPRDPTEPAFVARGLVKHFERGRVRAVDGIDLTIECGEFVAICGPSGCGKTTLLNLFAAIEHPDAGPLAIGGRVVNDLSDAEATRLRRSEIGLVFQLHNLLPSLSAVENVQVPMLGVEPSRSTRLERASALLEHVGVTHRGHALPAALSGGERQRVAVARALANRPRIVLADEPTGALDSRNSGLLMDLLEELHRESGITLVVVTHEASIARRADRVVRLVDGRLSDTPLAVG